MPSFIKKEPKDGTITESNKKNSKRETKSYYSTLESSSSVKESFTANGKDRLPSSTHQHMPITIQDNDSNTFKVNGQRLKIFLEPSHDIDQEMDKIDLISFNKFTANI